jgi:hypothetical protein
VARTRVALVQDVSVLIQVGDIENLPALNSSGHDIDVYLFGTNEAPLVAEVKGRKNGAGFTTIEDAAQWHVMQVTVPSVPHETAVGVLTCATFPPSHIRPWPS